MRNWKQKWSSRKLWTALAGLAAGLAAAFGLPENEVAQIAGIVTSAFSVIAYIFGEASIDAAHAETVEPAVSAEQPPAMVPKTANNPSVPEP